MVLGHNSNAVFGEATYHVQTEIRGIDNPFMETTVFFGGRVLHRRTNSYYDLLPLSPEREELLRQRVNTQHLETLEEIRSGALHLTPGPAPAQELALELVNPRSWLAGNQAHLEVAVRAKADQRGISGARVTVRIEGAAVPSEFYAQTGADGRAMLAFPMPRLGGGEAALVIQAHQGTNLAQLRFQLKAKPKTPATA